MFVLYQFPGCSNIGKLYSTNIHVRTVPISRMFHVRTVRFPGCSGTELVCCESICPDVPCAYCTDFPDVQSLCPADNSSLDLFSGTEFNLKAI